MQHEEYWATRTGRWRRALRQQVAPSFADRLHDVIYADIDAGVLPTGARLPAIDRVAAELSIPTAAVQAAYDRLVAEQHAELRSDGALHVLARGEEASLGDATQIRLERALIKSVREVAARGMSAHELTGVAEATHRKPAADKPQD
jgi:DNA-binding transcriptional regulator YhcF (GntR family)